MPSSAIMPTITQNDFRNIPDAEAVNHDIIGINFVFKSMGFSTFLEFNDLPVIKHKDSDLHGSLRAKPISWPPLTYND